MEPIYIKGVLDDKIFSNFSDHVESGNSEWFLSNRSGQTKNDYVFWGKNKSEIKSDIFYYKISSIIKYNLLRICDNDLTLLNFHVNGQTANQHGEPHCDYTEKNYAVTFVLFTSKKWNPLHGGEFIIQDPDTNDLKYYEYGSNCGILFSSDWKHMGQCPNTKTTRLRSTVAFRYCDSSNYEYFLKKHPKTTWANAW